MVGAQPPPGPTAAGVRRNLSRSSSPSSKVGLREFCEPAGRVTRCCSLVLATMGTPLTTTLHWPCGVTITVPSRLVKEACLSEILKKTRVCLRSHNSDDFSEHFWLFAPFPASVRPPVAKLCLRGCWGRRLIMTENNSHTPENFRSISGSFYANPAKDLGNNVRGTRLAAPKILFVCCE